VSLLVVDAGFRLSGVAVGGRCWFLVVGCRCRRSLLVPYCPVSLSVVVAGSGLLGVAVGRRFLVSGCRVSLSVDVAGSCLLGVGFHSVFPLLVPSSVCVEVVIEHRLISLSFVALYILWQ
jgi:hypothetical protein